MAVGCMMLIHCLSCTQYTGSLVGVDVLHRPRDCSSGLIVMVAYGSLVGVVHSIWIH
jgi:hypothetical protein